jgi:ABC-type glycerol-3-phosphate transport system substrate-binding protein
VTLVKQRRLWWVLSLLIAIAGGALSACGPAEPEATLRPDGASPTVTVPFELPTVIAIAGRFEVQELTLLDEQIAAFEAANPDIRVEVVAEPREEAERHDALASLLKEGDSSRDILLIKTTWLAEFATHGWLRPLDGHAASHGVEMGDFLPAAVQANTLSGQLMALPWTADGGLLYYRQDLLEKHGYAPPGTWPDVQRAALDIQTRESLPYGFVWQGAADESLTCNVLEFVWGYGGDVLDRSGNAVFDSPETHAALQQMADLVTAGISPADVTAYRETATLEAFQRGDAVLMRNWSYAWDRLNASDSPLAGRVGVAPLPASCLGGQSLALSAHSRHADKAVRFMAFLVSYEQQVQMALQGIQPPALGTVYHDAELLAAAPVFGALKTALSVTRPRPQAVAYAELSRAIYTEVNRMLAGTQDVEATAANVQRRVQAGLHP